MRWLFFSVVVLALLASCNGDRALRGAGETCLRTADCDITQGLACVAGLCSSDLGALAEAGMVPMLGDGAVGDAMMMDAAMDAPADAPVMDSAVPPDTAPPMDTSVPPDTTPPMDTSVPPDTTPPMDTGTVMDTGTPPGDAAGD